MKLGGFYETLNGNIGQTMAAASLNHALKDDFHFEEPIILCQLFFDNGKSEWWLNNQLEEVESPQVNLFKDGVE
ncbi:MAG: hypothetical protein ABS911_12670 [Carnobacterium sp.]|uniref:hypothetical protein n=1 Tax=Carnobacterium sp. TaxID=48221 RepID=UPI0033157DE7